MDRESGRLQRVEEPLYEILHRRCLSRDEWRELKRYSDSLGLAFFSTASFEEDIDLLVELGFELRIQGSPPATSTTTHCCAMRRAPVSAYSSTPAVPPSARWRRQWT